MDFVIPPVWFVECSFSFRIPYFSTCVSAFVGSVSSYVAYKAIVCLLWFLIGLLCFCLFNLCIVIIFNCAPGLWAGAQLYILGMSLTEYLSA